jgi:hypothetical protein
MNPPIQPLDLGKLKVFPLAERRSLTRADDILISPDAPLPPLPVESVAAIRNCAARIGAARERGASVMLIYGAHLLRNGAALLLDRMMERGWLTHLATNGAGTIHDWEYAWFGASTESVEMNVASGTFGAWHETATNIHLALMAGALDGLGYGRALGRFIAEDGATVPSAQALARAIASEPAHPLTSARADLLRALQDQRLTEGRATVRHRWKHASILASAWQHGVPLTVHPGIGYDIIANHPIFNGAVIGRAAELDFKLFGGSVERLGGGVVLSVGAVNNLRLQSGRGIVRDHHIQVVDLQDGGGWDWSRGEPPKTNAAYYLRFCKSFSRMGAPMHYLQCDNTAFVQHLLHALPPA